MNKRMLKSFMAKRGDTQDSLSEAMGISRSRLNAKINEKNGAEFTQTEIKFIAKRYNLTEEELVIVFFSEKVS